MSQGTPIPNAPPQKPPQSHSPGNAPLASLLDRFLGILIDGVIVMVPAIIFTLVLGLVLSFLGIFGALLAQVLAGLATLALLIGINYKLLATRGQTIGKTVMKTQIVSDNGDLIPINDLIVKRYLPIWGGAAILNIIPWVGAFAGLVLHLVNACMIFRANRKCLHDEICGSKVISLK